MTLRHATVPALALALAAPAWAQDAKPPAPPAQPEPKSKDQPKSEPKAEPKQDRPAAPPASPDQPSLDDLLGLPKSKPAETKPGASPRPAAADPSKADLDRKLSSREVAEQFKVAVDMMGETAQRIQTSRDTGLTTQRMQEDIIRKLDQLIKSAEQQQQKQSRSSRSQGQKDQQQNQPNQQQSSQRQQPGRDPAPDTIDPPPAQAPNPTPGTAARGAAWGSLPNRVRDALLQGNADKYSSLYQKWTEAYYKRLAEEGNK